MKLYVYTVMNRKLIGHFLNRIILQWLRKITTIKVISGFPLQALAIYAKFSL